MSKRRMWAGGLFFLIAALVMVFVYPLRPENNPVVQAGLQAIPASLGEFDRVTGPVDLMFPADHGPHEDKQTEWWYYTGNLDGENGERFGYQLTFFRRALLSKANRPERESRWGFDQVYLAHFALTDATGKKSRAFERLERGGAGLAGAESADGLKVWLHDWQVRQTSDNGFELRAAAGDVKLVLSLVDAKGIILQGDRGYSQKGPEPGNASIYFSQTRLVTSGQLEIGGQAVAVKGLSWMDHEYSTSALSQGQVGWDWFSLQLDDGTELMVYTIRRPDGSIDAYSQGTLVAADGSSRRLAPEDFQLEVESTWRSENSGGVYPAAWKLSVPAEELTLRIQPILPDQELTLSFTYWEGAVDVIGEKAGQPTGGRGYVELTGYAQSLEGRF